MFSEHIQFIEQKFRDNYDFSAEDIENILEHALKGEILSFEDLVILLSVDPEKDSELFKRILNTSREIKKKIFNNVIFPIVPVYVSSICVENCKYCNFRAGNKDKMIKRIRLSPEQLRREIEYLVFKRGLRAIELVYSTDPKIVPDIPKHIELTRSILDQVGGGIVGINAQPFSVEEYRTLKEAGLDFVVLWQETYQREYYVQYHPGSTLKANFEFRVNSFERMIKAGIKYFGLGVLSGLAPWRKDWIILMEHERYLFNKYGVKAAILGIPRLKKAAGAVIQSTPFIPTDKELLLAVAVHNLFSPTTLPFINTRESFDLCLELSEGGGVLFTFNCTTIPGGYTLGVKGYQFPTYSFDMKKYIPKVKLKGLIPKVHWKFPVI